MRLKKTPALTIRFLLLWSVAIIFEYPFLLSVLEQNPAYLVNDTSLTVGLHLMAAIAMFFSFPKQQGWLHYNRHWPQTYFFLTLFFPVFGVIMSGAFFFFYRENPHPEIIFSEEADFFMEPERLPSELEFDATVSSEDKILKGVDFLPLVDIMAGDDINLKRGAISKLAQMATPESINILLSHRGDQIPEIRFYITSSLSRVKGRFDDELDAAKEEMKRNLEDTKTRLALAKIYIRYIRSNLLDKSMQESYMNEAIYHLEFCCKNEPSNPQPYKLLLDLLEAQNKWTRMLALLRKMKETNMISTNEALKRELQHLFKVRKYDSLVKDLKTAAQQKDFDPKWLATAHWWGIQ